MREHAELGRDYGLVLVGRKAESYFRFRGFRIDAAFSGFSDQPSYEDARTIARDIERRFFDGEYDLVELIYTRFVSAGRQEVVVRPLMPLDRDILAGGDGRPTPAAEGDVPATLRVRARSRRDPHPAAPALRRGTRLRRAAERRGLGARGPPAP